MSSERKDTPVILSMSSLWPAAALRSSDWSAEIASKIGCDGLEILPGYSVVREFERKGQLKATENLISSFHDSWRRDRRAEIEHNLLADTNLNPKRKLISWVARSFFPNEIRTRDTLGGLETVYGAPVVSHWPEDDNLFQRPILEVQPYLDLSPQGIIEWAQKDSETRSLAIDVSQRKFWTYLEKQNIPKNEWRNILQQLLPWTGEAHFQISNDDELNQIKNQIFDGSLGQTLRVIKNGQSELPIVIEINFPLMTKLPRTTSPQFHQQVVDFIRKV
jgi:hypothetical protein